MIVVDCCEAPTYERGYIVHSHKPVTTEKVVRCTNCEVEQHGSIVDWSQFGPRAEAAVRDDIDLTQPTGTTIWL